MGNYPVTSIPDFLRIKSIISAFRKSNLLLSDTSGATKNFWEFFYVEKGKINVLVNDIPYTIKEKQLMLFEPASFRLITASTAATIVCICFETDSSAIYTFPGKVIEVDEQKQNDLIEMISLARLSFIPSLRSEYTAGMIARDNVTPSTLQKLANKLELFLIELYESTPISKPKREKITRSDSFSALVEYFSQHICETITLKKTSSDLSISIPALQRLCKKECGCYPKELFLSMKISEAKRLIMKKRFNLTEISQQLGFSSLHYFSKLFKRKTGMSPSEFSKQNTGG